jgi:hypothetical protein
MGKEINVSAIKLYEYIKEQGWILFETIVGSQAYGTNTPESDIDKKFVYILPDYLYGYIPQLHVNKDYVGFELGEFLQLIETNNPTLLELLNSPEDCVVYKHPIFDYILKERDVFITKKCADSFGGYSRAQIKKAKGQDKMMNWEKKKMTRKAPLDFCYIIEGYGTRPLKKFLKEKGMEQKFCGVINIPNARDTFALFYDNVAHYCFSKLVDESERERNKKELKKQGLTVGLGYKGIEKEEDELVMLTDDLATKSVSNNLRLSSIPKGEDIVCLFSYNKDSYTQHCKDYNKYQNWLKNRNLARWVDVEEHGQKIDGKNMLHCMRLIDMSIEIAEGKGIIVRRPNAKELLDIRKGKVDLDTLIKVAEEKIAKMDELFENSNLPKRVDHKFVEKLIKKIRKEFYGKN